MFLVIAVAAGAVCRAAQYAADQSFWVDEAALALNIRSHTVHQLFGKLDYEQAAPPVFMAAERGLLVFLGPSELSLRVLPLVCGVVSLVIFALLARRLLGPPWDALAVALYAFSDRFIWHQTEVKQYGTDLLMSVVLTWIAIGPKQGWSATRRLVLTAVVAAVAVWASYTVMFVFAAASLALIPRGRGRGCAVAPYLVVNAVAGTSFLVLIATVIRAQQTGGLTSYWAVEFLDLHRPWIWPWWVFRRVHSLCNYTIVGGGPVIFAAVIAGIVRMWRGRRFEQLVILAGPVGFVLIAAAAHRYPFDGARMMTFACGSLLIVSCTGLAWGVEATVGRRDILKWMASAPVAYVLILAATSAAMHLVEPRNRGHLRPVIAHVRKKVRTGDRVYVLNDRRAFLWYWPEAEGNLRAGDDVPIASSNSRFWVVWSFPNETIKRQADPVLRYARTFSREQDHVYSIGGGAVLMTPERAPTSVQPGVESLFVVP